MPAGAVHPYFCRYRSAPRACLAFNWPCCRQLAPDLGLELGAQGPAAEISQQGAAEPVERGGQYGRRETMSACELGAMPCAACRDEIAKAQSAADSDAAQWVDRDDVAGAEAQFQLGVGGPDPVQLRMERDQRARFDRQCR